MTTRTHSSWQHAAKSRQSSAPNTAAIDLAKPDAEAAAFASTLQDAAGSFTFTRVVMFIVKWILRPFFWWPIKYPIKLAWWSIFNTKDEKRNIGGWTVQQERDNFQHMYRK